MAGEDTEGCRVGATLGTSWHGVLESDGFRRALLAWVAAERNLDWRPGDHSFAAAREAQLERLGDLVADNVDREPLMRLIDDGPPSGLPAVRLQATGYRPQPGDSNGVSVPEESRPAGVETTSSASSASAAADAMPATRNLRPDA
jgi:adenosylcobyric acid synthase